MVGCVPGVGIAFKLRPCVNFPAVGTLSWTSCHGPALGHDDLYFPIFIPFSFGADNLEIMGICLRATERHLGRASSSAPFPPITLAEGKGARRVRLTSIPQGGTCSQVWEGQSQYMIWRQEWSGNRRYEGESGGSRTVVRGLPHAAWEELGSLCSGKRGCSLHLSTFRLCRMLIQIL